MDETQQEQAEEQPPKQKPLQITLRGREIDLRPHVPFTVGDWKALERDGFRMRRLADDFTVTDLAMIVARMLRKAVPDLTEDEVDALTLDDIYRLSTAARTAAEDSERPT